MGNIFCVKFKRYPLKFHTKHLSHTQVCISLRSEILRALKFDSSWAFLKRSPEMDRNSACSRKYPSLLARGPHTGVQAPSGGRFKNTCGLLNPRALFYCCIKIVFFNVWVRYFVWNFKGSLWNSTQNITPIYWKMRFLNNIGISRALRFKSSYAFLKRPLTPHLHWKGNIIILLKFSPVAAPEVVILTTSGSALKKISSKCRRCRAGPPLLEMVVQII